MSFEKSVASAASRHDLEARQVIDARDTVDRRTGTVLEILRRP
ncbi:hypothetical protein [Rhizobium sp. RAF56]